jgi:SAM-dependent methyltransferase
MHDTSIKNVERFISTYVNNDFKTIVEIGSKSYQGDFTFKSIIPSNLKYIGVDFQPGLNVDIVLDDPYIIPIPDNSVDYVLSSSCFEHSEFFWLSFNEVMRILKPGGLFYLNAPSNGAFHRYPVDCWRFYPDTAVALSKWAKRNNIECEVLEQYTSLKENDIWNDYVAIFIKGSNYISNYPNRIIYNFDNYINGTLYPNHEEYINKLEYVSL